MHSPNHGSAVTLKLTPSQHQWVEQAAREWADLQGHSIGRDAVLLKLMELGLPLFQAELKQKQALVAAKSKSRGKIRLDADRPRTLKIVPLA